MLAVTLAAAVPVIVIAPASPVPEVCVVTVLPSSIAICPAVNATEPALPDPDVVAATRALPVNVNKLRQILLQIADARIVEQKTSNPDRYSQLGVQDPGIQGSQGIQLTLAGPDMNYELIVRKLAQAGYRYVRIAEESQSWLIDQNLEIPDSVGEWLVREIVDIKSADIKSVSIKHADGEVLGISKESAEATDFAAANVPDNRELRYSTVANGIAGVLSALTLDDVRGGTFTLNNTGALGSVWGGGIINHPQAAILNTEAIVKRLVVVSSPEGDATAIRSIMNLCLSFDHRVVDGAEASAFVQDVKSRLEQLDTDSEIE